jgi:hypothetical protein
MPNINFFEILEIEPTTDLNIVKKAFRKQMMINHPDKNGDQEKCKEIVEAWEALEDQDNLEEHYEFVLAGSDAPSSAFVPRQEETQERKAERENPSDSVVPFGLMIPVFIPIYIQKHDYYSKYQIKDDEDLKRMREDNMTAINPCRFMTPTFDFNALTEIINYVLEIYNFKQIGLDMSEVKTIADQHSWYRHKGGYFGVSVKVNIADITERCSELDVSPHSLNAGKEDFLSLKKGSRIDVKNITAIHIDGDYTGMKLAEQHKKQINPIEPMLALPAPEENINDLFEKILLTTSSSSIESPLLHSIRFFDMPCEPVREEQDCSLRRCCTIL